MALEEYRKKRDFTKTREPEGKARSKRDAPIFVIQEHHATRLHWDLRLEDEGVLKSWAVPKEPTLDPSLKRLAVQVEDHPLDYATFEGTIPKGQYGGGTVSIWDHGTYENLMAAKPKPMSVAEALEAGHLEFALHGERLNGRFALVRMRWHDGSKPQWLLIKMKDEYSDTPSEKPKPAARRSPKKEPSLFPDTDGPDEGAKPAPRRNAKTRESRSENDVKLTNADKLMFPDDGITKGDVFAYYERIADELLPYLRDRPATLERLPDGISGPDAPHFYQKNTPKYYPDWIPRIELPAEGGKKVNYALVNSREALLYLVNDGTLTFHVWLSRVADLDRPDIVLFDLDPGRASLADAVEVAERLHATLDDEGVPAFVKTSGKSGLHVLVPWKSRGGFDEARAWARDIATRLANEMPDQATVQIRKAARGDRVYIDVLQNARGHHVVPPFVLRPIAGAPVSYPLDWSKLARDLDPKVYNLKSVFKYLARRKHDPFDELIAGAAKRRKSRSKSS
jgi:bifunctional non-homologous end joining protein LigD